MKYEIIDNIITMISVLNKDTVIIQSHNLHIFIMDRVGGSKLTFPARNTKAFFLISQQQ